MSPIRGVMQKVDRAKVHLDALGEFVKAFAELQSQAFSSYDDIEQGQHIVKITPPQMDLTGALIAGDFVCCLRSSLDHLVWQLVKISGTEPSKRTCFPIIGENSLDNQILFMKCVFGLPEKAIAVIRAMQPYQSGDAYKAHFLWILNTLWNIDKHRHIPLHAAITEFTFEPGTPKPIGKKEFDDHMEVFFALADKPNVKFNPLPKTDIQFGNKDEGVLVNFANLVTIYEMVHDQVIPAFASFFPQQDELRNQTVTW